MGVSIDMSSVISNASASIDPGDAKLSSEASAKLEEQAAAAGAAFASELVSAINSSGLSAGAISAVGTPSVGGVSMLKDGVYQVTVSLTGESRPSLDSERYGGISDMAALFDEGMTAGHAVYGEWPGHGMTWSRTVIPGAHFIDFAVRSFDRAAYNVINISVSK